ncbi:MAG: hypothetical protein ABJM06_01590 [Gilvibacter sp.]
MKKYIYILLVLFTSSFAFGQVGIDILVPLADLHVADPGGTIRIESLNATNNPTYNNGTDLSPVYVDGNGDIVLGNGTGASGQEPLNFLIDVPNFLADDPYGVGFNSGTVINNNALGEKTVTGLIGQVTVTTPISGWLELKYGVTTYVAGTDLSVGGCPCAYPTTSEAVVYETYFVIDLNNDGLSAAEMAAEYGYNGQSYVSFTLGTQGYAYINGQANLKAPAGTHTFYLYGVVKDSGSSYTSVGFGGAEDYLKIRVFN